MTVLKEGLNNILKKIISEICDITVEEVGDTQHFVNDLGMDLLKLVELSVEIERVMGIEVLHIGEEPLTTVDSVLEVIVKEIGEE